MSFCIIFANVKYKFTYMKKVIIIGFLTTMLMVTLLSSVKSQPPRPPSNPGNVGNIPIGGSAPIDGGLSILLVAAGLFGTNKYYKANKV